MGEVDVGFRRNPEVGKSEDVPKAETSGGPERNLDGNNVLSGITSGGQEMEGEYSSDGY